MKRLVLNLLLVLSLVLLGCANPGSPDGGPYDETPPHVTRSNPAFAQIDGKSKRIEIYFDELVKLNNASEKVVVSPPQIEAPDIASMGKYIRIKLQDSLKSNTTYSIDFSDAIVDNNEGNPLGNYSFVFSTGSTTDTMEVGGTVLNAENLEPIKGILVGLHNDTTDTAFTKKPFLRVARTDSRGHFVIRGVAQGTYKVYALQDADGNFCFSQKSEMIAFPNKTITTGSFPDIRMDTIWHDSIRYDSIREIPYTHYTPDDVTLMAFTETHADRHLLKTERGVPEHFEIYFTAPSDQLPKIKGLNFNEKDAFAVDFNTGKDTITYWVRDTLLAYQDTLTMAFSYMENDSSGNLVERTDTLEMVSKITHEKQLKWAQEAYKKWEKQQNKNKRKGLPYEKKQPVEPLDLECRATNMAPNENIPFLTKEPLLKIDTSQIHLYLRQDTLLVPAPFLFRQDGASIMHYMLYGEWRPEQEYQLSIDSATFVGIYGHVSKKLDYNFKIPSLDEYSSLFFNLSGSPELNDSLAIVQLLTSQDKVVYSTRSHNGKAEFFFIRPSSYYARLFIDRNGNGKWDEGDYGEHRQAEDTYYYPDKLQLRARWDVTQDWDINAVSRPKQKPIAITKQRPDKDKKIQNRNADRERQKNR